MLGTVVNALAIIIGSVVGITLKKGLKERYKETIMQGLSLTVIVIGLLSALKAEDIMLVIISIAIGSIIGEWIDIEGNLERLGNWAQSKMRNENSSFSKGFVTTSLLYCVGAMAIVGSLESGLTGNHETLFAKAIIDGISAVIFASTFGIGVAFSAISVFLYQGIITISASYAKVLLTDQVILNMSSVGGILIMGIAFNILEIKKIKIGNMLPAIFIPLIYYIITLTFKPYIFDMLHLS
ncbi:DUF554 domain-containing protein [Sporosalibacterium faouarense]|uniref:DUF554 domain-containing protein n=1 Tax=Sporosalibacterium faouarense TaxID=516123 RepID=UPI00192CB0E9|nr:DUF554 domain-containing protein [Sporosalibacterium faouarense]